MPNERVHIASRFLRSVRIDTDLTDGSALEGYICPQSFADVLKTMANHISETGQGAFTWTGPYGSGKSSLVLALGALLNGNLSMREQAEKVFGPELTNDVGKALPLGLEGWRIVPVVGTRDDPVSVIGEALLQNEVVARRPRGGWTESKLVTSLMNAAKYRPETYGGLVLFIDEMGKFFEAAVRDGSDIYVFQQLAETASRSEGRLLIIGILHQSFEEYTHRLSHGIRDEWAKVQGRFIDLVISVTGEEQVELISRAIESNYRPESMEKLCTDVAIAAQRNNTPDAERLASKLLGCWPLHPVVTCLLGPISRRRFGQNQRSLFSFLNSAELYGFQDFLKHAEAAKLYTPDLLWDYLRANLEPSILASPDGHRWALAAEALERCEAQGGDEIHVKLMKTIAVLDLFKERSGIVANSDILKTCFREIPFPELKEALSQLDKWSLTIFKKFLGVHAIYAGSDFDIDQATRSALKEIDEIDLMELKSLVGLHPVLAKRHYHETGALRWFEVNITSLSELIEAVTCFKPENGIIGQFLLALPTADESEEEARERCREAANHPSLWDSTIGLSRISWSIIPLARELFALQLVNKENPDLTGDPVAKREISERYAALQSLIEEELLKTFDTAEWFSRTHDGRHLRRADLNYLASELASLRFNKSPRLHNELLNRQKPSSSAVAAQNSLLRHMVLNEGEPRLGIEKFPPEVGLLESILKTSGLYRQNQDRWQFMSPLESMDPCNLVPMWEAAINNIKETTIAVSDLYALWRKPPFGVKDGLLPILSVAFILSQRDKLAIYREGLFKPRFDDVDVDYLAKNARTIQIRWMDLSDIARRLLSEMAAIVRDLDETNRLTQLEPIDVARGLVAIYDQLPQWTKRTMRLSANAVCIRNMFKHARDPNKFLFDDIPATLGEHITQIDENSLPHVVDNIRDGLEELVQAYPLMLRRLRHIMFEELQVPNMSQQSLAELHERAQNISQVVGDFKLEAFIGRLAQFSNSDASFENIASLAASKPPRNWIDSDLDRTTIEIAELAQKFLRAETFARVKGRPDKRHAMAVVVGMDNRPTPFHDEFVVTDLERTQVDELIKRVDKTLERSGERRRNIILAALAELSARYLKQAANEPNDSKQKEQTAS